MNIKIKPMISVNTFSITLMVCNFLNLDAPASPMSLAALITGIMSLLVTVKAIIAISKANNIVFTGMFSKKMSTKLNPPIINPKI